MGSLEQVLNALRAAAEPTRLRLLALCAHGELTVTELTQILGQSQPRVSRHLKQLCDAGLLDRLPEGSWVFYRLHRDGPGGRIARQILDLLPTDENGLARDRERLTAVRRARAEAAARYFRENAARWDEIRSLHIDDAEVERRLIELIPPSSIRTMLDIGTGTGRILELFGSRGAAGVGIDLSHEMLQIARANLDRAGLKDCYVRQGDMYQLPWPGPSFDAVTIHQVLHFADEPAQVIAEAARVLKPGGRLAIADFAPHELDHLRSEHAHRRLGFSDEEVRGWITDAGLIPGPVVHLPGKKLTVSLWQAERPRQAERFAA
jgi:ubiquinone/menaquinone biosynthesis C-methylase UbiE